MRTPHQPGPLLTGKVALVTGGGGGIGRGISLAFAAHGATVIVAEIDEQRAQETVADIEAAGGRALAQVVDVTDPAGVERLAVDAGPVDVLVNNVGHYLFPAADFVESGPEEWEALYRINLGHVLLVTRAVLPGMIERGRGGSVINVSTVEAFRAKPQSAVYAAYKGAVTQFTKSLAMEVGIHHIRVNAIAPDLTESLQIPYERWVKEDQHALIPTWVPIGRFGTPDDHAGVALFLASDLGAFVTGTTVHADGGSYAAGGWFRTARGGWTNRPLAP
ncbi:MAG TPA: SDR family NAD(P)-dependent oxidoreductase [Acidimicrobiales bacterium]|jgi:NAD(P)-dependent dehydrogenase (short-subunit alcohol dehydrogenase family)|nr:SDR family NAD(P)-dependent oxidoreductase [Acidimicrobiales bacterium]